MKKEYFTHFAFLFTFFILIFLVKRWLDISYLHFVVGGIIGTLLPDTDYFVDIFYLRPQSPVLSKGQFKTSKALLVKEFDQLSEKRNLRTKLIFHTVTFQVIFTILAFLVITSSGSVLGKGLVLAFMLHLLVDQLMDFIQLDSLAIWFRQIPSIYQTLDRTKVVLFWLANALVLLGFGFLL